MANSVSLVSLVGFCLIIIAGGIVVSEFSSGTVKFLLVAPVKRWKILVSKYTATLLMGVMMMALLLGTSFVMSLICFGGSDAFLPYLSAKAGELQISSAYLHLLRNYLLSGVEMVVMATFAFALSSISKSSSLAIGITLVSYLTGDLIVSVLQFMNRDWARYLIFSNLDFVAIVDGTTGFSHHSLTTAILIVVLHMVVFFLTAWDGFTKRDV